jgi:hypothetical protein
MKPTYEELQAQIEVLREKLTDIQETTSDKAYVYQLQAKQALRLTPAACLVQVKAEAGRAAYLSCLNNSFGEVNLEYHKKIADQYAERIRQEVV